MKRITPVGRVPSPGAKQTVVDGFCAVRGAPLCDVRVALRFPHPQLTPNKHANPRLSRPIALYRFLLRDRSSHLPVNIFLCKSLISSLFTVKKSRQHALPPRSFRTLSLEFEKIAAKCLLIDASVSEPRISLGLSNFCAPGLLAAILYKQRALAHYLSKHHANCLRRWLSIDWICV